jgi:hypothetical protein
MLSKLALHFAFRSRAVAPRVRTRQPTAKQQAAALKADIAALDTALEMIGTCQIHYKVFDRKLSDMERRRFVRNLGGAVEPLTECRRQVQQQLDWLTASGERRRRPRSRRGNRGAAMIYTEFWIELTRLWQRLVPDAITQRHRHELLRRFLRACSKPVFPGATTDAALRAFTERHFPQMNT